MVPAEDPVLARRGLAELARKLGLAAEGERDNQAIARSICSARTHPTSAKTRPARWPSTSTGCRWRWRRRAPQIRHTLFLAHPEELPEPLAGSVRDPLAFADLTAHLRAQALARVEVGSLPLHRLVQSLLRGIDVSLENPATSAAARTVGRLLKAAVDDAPPDYPESWAHWRPLLQHVLASIHNIAPADVTVDLAWVYGQAGVFVAESVHPGAAVEILERAVAEARRVAARGRTCWASWADSTRRSRLRCRCGTGSAPFSNGHPWRRSRPRRWSRCSSPSTVASTTRASPLTTRTPKPTASWARTTPRRRSRLRR